MHRSRRVASAFAAIILAVVLAPVAAPAPTGAAGECGTYRSETAPPPTIRVYRTASGAVDTVDFRTYVKNVLSQGMDQLMDDRVAALGGAGGEELRAGTRSSIGAAT